VLGWVILFWSGERPYFHQCVHQACNLLEAIENDSTEPEDYRAGENSLLPLLRSLARGCGFINHSHDVSLFL